MKDIISLLSLATLATATAVLPLNMKASKNTTSGGGSVRPVPLLTSILAYQPTHRLLMQVYYCSLQNWAGNCQLSALNAGECLVLPLEYSKLILSIGAEQGASCFLMQDHCNANDPYTSVTYPGYTDLASSTVNLPWYGNADSIFCE